MRYDPMTINTLETTQHVQPPLRGIRVLVTRPRAQADTFMQKLRDLGAKPVLFPTIRIAPAEDRTPLERAVANLVSYDWIIFTSQNAIAPFWECLTGAGLDAGVLQSLKIGAIGPKTAAAVRERGIAVDFVPTHYVAEAVVEEIGDVAGQRILLPRADIARPALLDGLRTKGADVNQVTAYRTVLAEPAESVLTQVLAGQIDMYTFTASSTVRNFVEILEEHEPRTLLQNAIVAAIGPITAGTLAEYGVDADIVAEEHTIDGLIEAIVGNVMRHS